MTTQQYTRLNVKVAPSASASTIVGWMGDALKVRVTAPPEKGKANDAVKAILAEALGISTRAIEIVSGASSTMKIVEVTGISEKDLKARLDDINA